jgi:hypothetical protein
VSGPQRRPAVEAATRSRLSAGFIRLIDHPLLERLVRGRAWIALVATVLLAVVAMQVVLLRLGAQIGSQTQAYNTLLQKTEATESAIGGIEANDRQSNLVSSTGMVYAPPGAVTYLQANPGDGRRAADHISSPSSAALVAAAAHPAAPPAKTATSAGTTAGGASVTGTSASAGNLTATSQNALKTLPPNSGTGAPTTSQLTTTNPASTVPVTTSGTASGGSATTTGTTSTSNAAVTTPAGGTTPPTSGTTSSAGGTQTGP